MPFDPLRSMTMLSDLPFEEWGLISDGKVRMSRDSWDSKTVVFGGIWPDVQSPAQCAALIPTGFTAWIGGNPYAAGVSQDPYFYIQEVDFTCEGVAWIATCECLGFADPFRPAARRVRSGTEQQQGNNIVIAGFGGPFERVRALCPVIEYERIYPMVEENVDLSVIGTELTPPDAPDVPANPWTYLTNPEVRAPAGWVLMDRAPEYLTGVPPENIALVRDLSAAIYRYAP